MNLFVIQSRLLVFLVLIALPSVAYADALDDARAGIERRFEALRDVRIEYDLHEVHRAPPGPLTRTSKVTARTRRQPDGTIVTENFAPGQEKTTTITLLDGEIIKHCIWRRCQDCVRLEISDDGTAPDALRTDHRIQSAYGNRVDMLTHEVTIQRHDGQDVWKRKPAWCIAAREGDPISQIDISLGLRLEHRHGDRLLTLPELRSLEVVDFDDETLTLSWMERGSLHLLRFNGKLGWALENYRELHHGLLAGEWRCEDFRQVNGIWMPHSIKMHFKSPLVGPEWPGHSHDITVKKVEFAPQDGGEASFPLVFPNGSIVHDARSGWGYKIETGDQTISDEKIATRMEAYDKFEKEAQERISKGWKPTEDELRELMAKHLKAITK